MRTKFLVRDWLRERKLPIFDEEDRIRLEDGFNANFSVIDDPMASLEYEDRPPPPQQQQLKHELEGNGEVLGGGARHTDEQQQKDEVSDQRSEGPSAFWGIDDFSAILQNCPPMDSDEICNLDLSNDVDLLLDGVLGSNDEVTSPSSLPPVDSGARTRPSVVLGPRQQFLVASMRYYMRIVGSAKKHSRDCEGKRQQTLLRLIESNLQLFQHVHLCQSILTCASET
ncbi:hypothetical protein KFL_013350030 [Klebsormidium nitens]|uniref:Uncharacterized protein n=1 Tax=Klebsormidium nitens TaxID=105231 RepID=A0A1Y1IW88_KLENI|nr:hypothetical protein KFL_013350030 [Klebsormidium nitens]|eukprot:GAQ93166.1 hypothetical protein KFL_013350030 [Klebsormidium nitens]